MATCNWCKKEMSSDNTETCVQEVEFPDGTKLTPVKWDGPGRCHDCNISPGGLHHPGCDMERCPKCKGQLISCSCLESGNDK